MADIACQPGFAPHATWLVARRSLPDDPCADCGTIQGLALSAAEGSDPEHWASRRTPAAWAFGRALVLQAVAGFQAAGVRRVSLEVTVGNAPAFALYRFARLSRDAHDVQVGPGRDDRRGRGRVRNRVPSGGLRPTVTRCPR